MSFVQSYDPNTNRWCKIEVSSGAIVDEQPRPFNGIDEVEPLEADIPERTEQSDPLASMRNPASFRLKAG